MHQVHKEDQQKLWDLGIDIIDKVTNCCGGETYHLNLTWNNKYFELYYDDDISTWCHKCQCETKLVYLEEVENVK